VKASGQYLRMSPRKARLVVEHIRGRSVPEARTVLAFTPRVAAREVEKILASAVANAEANHGLLGDDLIVSAAYVDQGPVIKRWRARARGRVARIKKPTCHVTIRLTPAPDADGQARRPRRQQAAAAAPAETSDVVVTEEEAATEEKPKRTRKPAAKKPAASGAKKDETKAEKPKPKRAPRRKKEEES